MAWRWIHYGGGMEEPQEHVECMQMTSILSNGMALDTLWRWYGGAIGTCRMYANDYVNFIKWHGGVMCKWSMYIMR